MSFIFPEEPSLSSMPFPEANTFGNVASSSMFLPWGAGADMMSSSVAVAEDEAELLRAELDLLSTPVSKLYAETAFYALAEARSQCFADVVTLCPSSLLQKASTSSMSPETMIAFSRALSQSSRRRMDDGHHHGHGHEHEHDHHDKHAHDWHPRDHEGGREDEHRHDWHQHHQHDHHRDHQEQQEQDFSRTEEELNREERNVLLADQLDYSVPLGWGEDADACLYAQWALLSQPCQEAALQLQTVREAFVEDDSWYGRRGHHHFGGLLLLFLGMLACAMCWKAKAQRSKLAEVDALLSALHANPDLKASVESITGTPVPVPALTHHHHHHHHGSRWVKLVIIILKLLLSFFSAFVLVHLAAFITIHIMYRMSFVDEQTGEVSSPGPGTAVAIMLAVTAALVGMFALGVRALKRITSTRASPPHHDRDSGSTSGPGSRAPSSSASAPPAVSMPSFPYIYNGFLVRRAAPEGYVALRPDDEHATAMVANGSINYARSGVNVIERPVVAQFATPVAIC